jgi:hypothetical protein
MKGKEEKLYVVLQIILHQKSLTILGILMRLMFGHWELSPILYYTVAHLLKLLMSKKPIKESKNVNSLSIKI